MNLGQALGQLQLRIHELEERRGNSGSSAALMELEVELDAAKKGETKALLLLAQERKLREQVEAQASRAFERLGERADSPEQARKIADLTERNRNQLEMIRDLKHELAEISQRTSPLLSERVKELEASIRGKDQRIAELERKVAQPAPAPQPVDCPVCLSIKLMVLGVHPRPASHVPAAAPVVEPALPQNRGHNQTAPGAVRGIAKAIRDALAAADRPLTSGEIAQHAGLPTHKIATNVAHLRIRGELVRLGICAPGIQSGGYRYWLASRPLPQGEQA